MKYNFLVFAILILFFIYLISCYLHSPIEGFENAYYVESNNLVNSSCNSVYNRQYIMDENKDEYIKKEYQVQILSRPSSYCISPAIYNDCNDTCECPDNLLYDPSVGCVTLDYYYVEPEPEKPPNYVDPIPFDELTPPPHKCPPGYIYDKTLNACFGKCLINEYYDVDTGKCVKDCSYSWSEWTACNVYTGTITRDPTIIYQPNKYGKACPTREVSNCIVDCSYSWGEWSKCDVSSGKMYRDPRIIYPAIGGKACPTRDISKCDVDCSYSWSEWTDCDSYSGTQSRELKIHYEAKNDGKICPSPPIDTKSCGVECSYKTINPTCNDTDGHIYYTIQMDRPAVNRKCTYDSYCGEEEVVGGQLVKSKETCAVDCDYDLITPHCNEVTGNMHYVINMVKPAMNKKCYYNGVEVTDNQIVESNEPCAVDCQYYLTNPVCLNNTIHKTVVMVRDAVNRDCRYNPSDPNINLSAPTQTPTPTKTSTSRATTTPPKKSQSSTSNTTKPGKTPTPTPSSTPSPTVFKKNWNARLKDGSTIPTYNPSAYSLASLVVGNSNGQQKIRNGDVVDTGEYCEMPDKCSGGPPAPPAPPTQPPTQAPAPVDCVGDWGGWSDCKKKTVGGFCKRERNYSIVQPAKNGGKPCPYKDGEKQADHSNCKGNDTGMESTSICEAR